MNNFVQVFYVSPNILPTDNSDIIQVSQNIGWHINAII